MVGSSSSRIILWVAPSCQIIAVSHDRLDNGDCVPQDHVDTYLEATVQCRVKEFGSRTDNVSVQIPRLSPANNDEV